MPTTLHIKANKKKRLVELLCKTDKRRHHSLYICSCYFSPDAAKALIKAVASKVRLNDVTIYIDRKTAISFGSEYLSEFCASLADFEVSLWAVESNFLFHSKSYALLAFDDSDNITGGSLVLGSANLTTAGLTGRSGNTECLIDSQAPHLLDEFFGQLSSLQTVGLDDIAKFSRRQEYSFKYALIQEGAFLHKWNDNLEQFLSIRYRLSPLGRSRIKDPSLEEAGFVIETATVSKKYFKFDYTPKHLEDTENLTRNFGIETHLGFWLPYAVIESMFDKEELKSFTDRLFSELQSRYDAIMDEIHSDFSYLAKQGLVEKMEVSPGELFSSKVETLKCNDLKLKKIFSKYEIFYLPYDIQQQDDILWLFDEMVDVSESRTRKNKAMKAFLHSYATFSIHEFQEALAKEMV